MNLNDGLPLSPRKVIGLYLHDRDAARTALAARPFDPGLKALPGAAGGVKGNADENEHDGKHDDSGESFHGYSFPI